MNDENRTQAGGRPGPDPLAIVDELYAPVPMDPVRRHAFDRALEERLAKPRRPAWFGPVAGLAAAGALAAVLWLFIPGDAAGPLHSASTPDALASAPDLHGTPSAWDYELFFPAELGAFEVSGDSELPETMQDIAAAFLDG